MPAAATTSTQRKPSTGCGQRRSTCGDTHTAVAVRVYEDYRARTGDETPTVIASTASPFKFCRAVIEALGGTLEKDDVTQLDVLTGLTGVPAPAPLAALAGKTPRFDRVVDKAGILSTVALLKDL